ncbi:hypothetical protein L9F63_010016, partial [Diploptera punctata]
HHSNSGRESLREYKYRRKRIRGHSHREFQSSLISSFRSFECRSFPKQNYFLNCHLNFVIKL